MHLSECTGGGCSYAALWHSTLNDSDHMHIALSSATSTCDGLEERPLRQTWRSACIKASKADQLHRGAIIMLGGTGADLSPVVVILDWHIGRPGICWHFTSVHQWQSSSNNNGIGMTGHLSQRGCVNSWVTRRLTLKVFMLVHTETYAFIHEGHCIYCRLLQHLRTT